MRISRCATALAVAAMLTGGMALADPPRSDAAPGYGMGPAMMGGYGYRRISDLSRQAVEDALDAHEKIDGVLTAEQRKAWRRAEGRE